MFQNRTTLLTTLMYYPIAWLESCNVFLNSLSVTLFTAMNDN